MSRALGRSAEAVAAATRAAELAEPSDDHHEVMLVLNELVAAECDAGDLDAAVAHTLELKQQMWKLHRRQTAQLVEQVGARASSSQQRRSLEAQTAAAIRSTAEDSHTDWQPAPSRKSPRRRGRRNRNRSPCSWPTSTTSRRSTTPSATRWAITSFVLSATSWHRRSLRPGRGALRR